MLETTERGWQWVAWTWLKMAAFAGLGAAGTFFYARQIEPRWLDWHTQRLTLPSLPRAFNGYRLIQLSDLHLTAGKYPSRAQLRRIIQRVNQLHPAMVVITGDFVSDLDEAGQRSIAELAALKARDGVFGITGNHDYWSGVKGVTAAAESAGVRMLNNAHQVIRRGGESLAIIGVEDVWEGDPDLDKALRGIAPNTPVILLAHEPNFADVAAAYPQIMLQLSGHTHGGQIRFPFAGPLVLPDLSSRYPMGLYKVQKGSHTLMVYTNRGVGLAQVPLRFNCRPEITIFDLQSGQR